MKHHATQRSVCLFLCSTEPCWRTSPATDLFCWSYSDHQHPLMCFNWCINSNWVITHDPWYYTPLWFHSFTLPVRLAANVIGHRTWRRAESLPNFFTAVFHCSPLWPALPQPKLNTLSKINGKTCVFAAQLDLSKTRSVKMSTIFSLSSLSLQNTEPQLL